MQSTEFKLLHLFYYNLRKYFGGQSGDGCVLSQAINALAQTGTILSLYLRNRNSLFMISLSFKIPQESYLPLVGPAPHKSLSWLNDWWAAGRRVERAAGRVNGSGLGQKLKMRSLNTQDVIQIHPARNFINVDWFGMYVVPNERPTLWLSFSVFYVWKYEVPHPVKI